MQGQSASPGPRASLWWTAALILGLVLACYFPALRGGFLWDDDAHVTRPGLRSLAGLWQIWQPQTESYVQRALRPSEVAG